jgi:hypothetical protein
MDQTGKGRRNMTKTHENAKALAVQKPKMVTFREFVEFRKQFGDKAIKRLVTNIQNIDQEFKT